MLVGGFVASAVSVMVTGRRFEYRVEVVEKGDMEENNGWVVWNG